MNLVKNTTIGEVKSFSRFALVFLMLIMGTNFFAQAQQWKLIDPAYETQDAVVAGFSLDDVGATGDGVTDVTAVIQEHIDALGAIGGGTLFLPAGRYVVRGQLTLRKGVILRGEWKKPVKGHALEGTILMVYPGRGSVSEDEAFITMQPSSSVQNLIFWYPEQIPGNIVPYPPTILLGEPDYFGNDYCNVKNITLVNSYMGIIHSSVNGGSCPVINHIYGTPLSLGIEIDDIADVGRIENIHFSPLYWSHSGLPNAPVVGSSFEKWIFSNGTGIAMRRNDWSYTCYVSIDGYNKGLYVAPSGGSPGAAANGHNYAMVFKNCHTALYFETVSDVGIMYSRVDIIDCCNGITVGPGTLSPVQLHTCTISASQNAITTDAASKVKLMMQHCTVNAGQVIVSGGTWTASDCDFNDDTKPITIGANARAILTGNRFADVSMVKDHSLYGVIIDDTPANTPALPAFNDTVPGIQKPGKHAMINAAGAPYHAKNDGVTDNTSAIQDALDDAGSNGGGVVFLPPGKYKILGTLTVPTGVELKGAVDISTAPMGPGTVLEVYAGKGNESGTPFLRLSPGSGLRGLVIDYPEQMGDFVPNFLPYPYCIQVTGEDVYIVNTGLRGAYNGVDLFTYQCDNHFIDYLAGQVLKTGIRVGNNSTGGSIWNVQFNPIGYAYGYESKWGGWSNSPSPDNIEKISSYFKENLNFMILDDCSGESLYNNFHYGSQAGFILNGGSGISMGTGIDGSRKALVIESVGTPQFDFINSQIVSIDNVSGTCYIENKSESSAQVTLFNADFWGFPANGISAISGQLNFQLANFQYPGTNAFANISTGHVAVRNSAIMPVPALLNAGKESYFSALSSILDTSGIDATGCDEWVNNLPNAYMLDPGKIIPRTGWTATASHNNALAGNGIDSDESTRWDAGIIQSNGQWFVVDMKGSKTFNQVILDYVISALDYPAAYAVYVSDDGVSWGDAVATGQGKPEITYIGFPTQTARYIRIVQTGSTTEKWWSIHELYVVYKADEPVTGIMVSPTAARIGLGETITLAASVFPENTADPSLNWTTSDPSVAAVNSNGQVEGTGAGSVLVTASSAEGDQSATSFVTVAIPVASIGLQPRSINLEKDAEYQLTAVIEPTNATFKEVSWRSADPAVVIVDENGVIRALGTGNTEVILTCLDNGLSDYCTVNVSQAVGLHRVGSKKSMFELVNIPAHDIAYVDVHATIHSAVRINLYDMNGRHIRSYKKQVAEGTHRFGLDIEGFDPGVYLVHFILNNGLYAGKMIVW